MKRALIVVAMVWTGFARSKPAWGTRDPSDYRSELYQRLAREVEGLNQAGHFAEAIALGERIERRVEASPWVQYEIGFAQNALGNTDAALKLFNETIRVMPDYAPARYDRGEILLLRGMNDEARIDFAVAAELKPYHWAAFFRLAHLDARSGDKEAFEVHLTEAIRQGFDFRSILGDPDWRKWANDKQLGPVIARLITVYGDEALLDQLRQE